MDAAELKPGMLVQIAAADDFYGYIDGWIGSFQGWQSGYPVIVCKHQDGIDKTFYVPAAQLRPAPFGANDVNG